jgi:predicted outer membrane repeat protein
MFLHTFLRHRVVAVVALAGLMTALIVVGATPGVAVSVESEAAFRAAWANAAETRIELEDDITLRCPGGVAIRNSAIPLALDGNGHTIRQTCANNGVLQQDGVGALTLRRVKITGGQAPAGSDGGGLQSNASFAVDHVTVTGNSAGRGGGGVHAGNTGTFTVTESTISNNRSGTEAGGGIAIGGGGAVVTITRSTVSGNTAGAESGGGISVGGGGSTLTLTNSTVTANSAPRGGGISALGIALVYATVVDNSAPTGANVSIFAGGTHTSFATVIGLPQGGANCAFTLSGFVSAGYSFEHAGNTCGFGSGPGDVVNGPNPRLEELADNGGPTRTRLPDENSPLVDAIPDHDCRDDGASGVGTDQRGVERPQDDRCDIGAVEVEEDEPDVPPTTPATPLILEPVFTG